MKTFLIQTLIITKADCYVQAESEREALNEYNNGNRSNYTNQITIYEQFVSIEELNQ